jgi:hypothetical protein
MSNQEEARTEEYRQVAALVCLDLDALLEVVEHGGRLTADELRAQIRRCHAKKEQAVNDPEARRRRYEAACLVFGAAAAGLVRSEEMKS